MARNNMLVVGIVAAIAWAVWPRPKFSTRVEFYEGDRTRFIYTFKNPTKNPITIVGHKSHLKHAFDPLDWVVPPNSTEEHLWGLVPFSYYKWVPGGTYTYQPSVIDSEGKIYTSDVVTVSI